MVESTTFAEPNRKRAQEDARLQRTRYQLDAVLPVGGALINTLFLRYAAAAVSYQDNVLALRVGGVILGEK